MKLDVSMMTNRELYTEYENDKKRYEVLAEMARRIHWVMITKDVPQIFSQYKLNGAGDQRK